MNESTGEVAPEVQSILETAADRPGGDERVSVTPRSLSAAFAAAERDGRVPVIAEVKPTSPTTDGETDADPVALAKSMIDGGAAALSVLTEPEHFGGSIENLQRVREAVDVPVLRKDFVLREAQLDTVESDVILLIARFLGDDLEPMLEAARDRGFQVLVEVHTKPELDAAIDAGADIIGINNRDLAKLAVDLATVERLAPNVPDDVTLIAESGVSTVDDVRRMREAGANGLLIGSAIMDGDPQTNTQRLTGAE
ncbi:indole-3-glycerol-phosphate synthase [Halonotius terrestris]|uniref:Indole-3-glycerol phosphate synthase n=1 Tax=Halonotius terrestris TaxID=2487750 RepID=A0A8J8PAL0_9EURY|nr:indole-3-glycerol phosphate synthase [Halonotius terrestris]TQQ82840.1 indole-3-glycerol-phosphate synthase [Halonotius terrestris]